MRLTFSSRLRFDLVAFRSRIHFQRSHVRSERSSWIRVEAAAAQDQGQGGTVRSSEAFAQGQGSSRLTPPFPLSFLTHLSSSFLSTLSGHLSSTTPHPWRLRQTRQHDRSLRRNHSLPPFHHPSSLYHPCNSHLSHLPRSPSTTIPSSPSLETKHQVQDQDDRR